MPDLTNDTLIVSSKDLPRYIDALSGGHEALRLRLASSDSDSEIRELSRQADRLSELLRRLEHLARTPRNKKVRAVRTTNRKKTNA